MSREEMIAAVQRWRRVAVERRGDGEYYWEHGDEQHGYVAVIAPTEDDAWGHKADALAAELEAGAP